MILVTGSLAFDYIMNYDDQFRNSILPENLHNLSVSFLVNTLDKHFGGTAGNIAYNLKLLSGNPLLLASAGNDFDTYIQRFQDLSIPTEHVSILPHLHTASCFTTTDKEGNQIIMFHPGAMGEAMKKDLSSLKEKISIAILAPEIPETVLHYVSECRKHAIPFVFDPGQNIHVYSKEQIRDGVMGAKGLILNDYEWSVFEKTSGLTKESVLDFVELLIITQGKKGSVIMYKDGVIEIPTCSTEKIVDPTGCGDAFRAGFLVGLSEGKDLEYCGKMGACAATYCLEQVGTQNHSYSLEEFGKRGF